MVVYKQTIYRRYLQHRKCSTKIIEVVKSSARIVTNAGLSLVGAMLDEAGFHDKYNHLPVALAQPKDQISCADVFAAAIGAMCSSSPSFEAAHESLMMIGTSTMTLCGLGDFRHQNGYVKGLTRLPWMIAKANPIA